jgi:hypothetical protein
MDTRRMIREWWRDRLDAPGPCDLQAAADEAVAALLADPAFRPSLEELLRPYVLEVGQRVLNGRIRASRAGGGG